MGPPSSAGLWRLYDDKCCWPSLHGIGTWLCSHRILWFSLGRDFPCPLTYLTHDNRKTTWTLTIDAISLLNYCQSSLSTRTHTQTDRQTGECLSCLLYSWRKRDHLRTHGSPVQTITYDFSQTNVQIYSIDYVSVYSKKVRILINFPCYNLRLPPAPSGVRVNDIHKLCIMCDPQPDDHYVQSGGAVKCITNVKNERLNKYLRGKSETCELMRQQNLCLSLIILLFKDPHNSPDTVLVKLLQDPSQTAVFRK